MSDDLHTVTVPPSIANLVPGFLENRRKELAVLQAAAGAGDFPRLSYLAHNLKGVAGSYGFSYMSDIGLALEQAAAEADQVVIEQQLHLLTDHISRLQVVSDDS